MAVNEILFVSRSGTLLFREPREVVVAARVEQVHEALQRVDTGIENGMHAAGYVAYEATPAFDPALVAHPPSEIPLVWFGLYDRAEPAPPEPPAQHDFQVGEWLQDVPPAEYAEALRRIKDYIAAGDTYQVNYTVPMRAPFGGDTRAWFEELCRAQRADYSCFLETERFQVLSLSPELFFRLDGDHIESRPMKGTRRRGLFPEADDRAAHDLAASEKDRAENVMIVDLIRNDLGRVCDFGTVRVQDLFQIERYETVWQMTSTVAGRTRAGLSEILAALFPCGSVTGAPKVRTMQILRELERHPRGVYCGCMGWWLADRRAQFNVAIRTICIDTAKGEAEYHTGGGITWDSTVDGERDECNAKTAILNYHRPEFDLLESLAWNGGYHVLEEHLERLASSAHYFGFPFDRAQIEEHLRKKHCELRHQFGVFKVRLLLSRDGTVRIKSGAISPLKPLRVALAQDPVREDDVFLYHKTTHREVYEHARKSRPECDDVVLWNTRGEITESTIANIVIDLGGEYVTPPVTSGLLAGTLRARLLKEGRVKERVVTKDALASRRRIWLINSVRGWMPVQIEKR